VTVIEAQEVVEVALAAAARSGADGCIVLVDETSHADVRFALNTTTTNGVRRDRSVTSSSWSRAISGWALGGRGPAQRGGRCGADGVGRVDGCPGAPPADDAFTLVDGMGAAGAGAGGVAGLRAAPVETDLSVLGGVLSGLSSAFARAAAHRCGAGGLCRVRGVDAVSGQLDRGAPVLLAADRGRQSGRAIARRCPLGLDRRGAERIGEISFGEMEDELWRRLAWARRPLSLEAGRYEVILPPSGVADMMGSLFFYGMGGQDAEDGRTVFSAAGGGRGRRRGDSSGHGTRVTSSSPRCPSPSTAIPSSPGSSASPSSPAARRTRRRPSSTTACRWNAPTGSGTGAWPTSAITGPVRPVGRRGGAVHRQPDPAGGTGGGGGRRRRSTRWWPAPSGACC
jgi:hypothetical protein